MRAPGAVVFVRIGPIRFLAGSRKRRLNQGLFGFARFSFWGFLCISLGFLYFIYLFIYNDIVHKVHRTNKQKINKK